MEQFLDDFYSDMGDVPEDVPSKPPFAISRFCIFTKLFFEYVRRSFNSNQLPVFSGGSAMADHQSP